MSLDALAHRVRPAAGDSEGALVLLHGRGTSELDLLPLLDELDPDRRLVGVTPRGPLSLPPGGAHWYAVRQIGYPDPGTFDATYGVLSSWIDALADELGVPIARTVIGVEWGRDARARLDEAGAAVIYREAPIAHSVDPSYLAELAGWLERTIDAAPP